MDAAEWWGEVMDTRAARVIMELTGQQFRLDEIITKENINRTDAQRDKAWREIEKQEILDGKISDNAYDKGGRNDRRKENNSESGKASRYE